MLVLGLSALRISRLVEMFWWKTDISLPLHHNQNNEKDEKEDNRNTHATIHEHGNDGTDTCK